MPQMEFWATRHPVRLVLTMHIDPTSPENDGQATVKVEDQGGAAIAWTGGTLPSGFASWAFADACRAACEAWELGGPEDIKRAFARALTQWRRDARAISQQG